MIAGTNRYLKFWWPFWVSPYCPGPSEALRVLPLVLDGIAVTDPQPLYVGQPVAQPDEFSDHPGLTFNAAALQCSPHFTDWGTYQTLAVYGAEIMPNSQYVVQRADSSCADLTDDACWSNVTDYFTGKFGDVAPLFDGVTNPPQPDFYDIAAVVQKFLAAPDAPSKVFAQLVPNIVRPDQSVSFRDIAADVAAFVGTPYAELGDITGPCTCPSPVVCGAAPCAGDAECPDGFCIEGFCRDACGRCSP